MYFRTLYQYCRKNWRFVLGIAGAAALLAALALAVIDWRRPEEPAAAPEQEAPGLREGRWDALRRIPERTAWMARLAEAHIEARERDPGDMTALMEAAPAESALAAVAPTVRQAFTEPLRWTGHEADVMAQWVPLLFGDGAGLEDALARYGIVGDSPAAVFVDAGPEGFSAALVLACEDFGAFVRAFADSLGAEDGLELDAGANGRAHLPADWVALDASPWVVLGRNGGWLDTVERGLTWARREAADSETEPEPGAWAVRVQASQLAASPLPSWLTLMLAQAIPGPGGNASRQASPPLRPSPEADRPWAYLQFGLDEGQALTFEQRQVGEAGESSASTQGANEPSTESRHDAGGTMKQPSPVLLNMGAHTPGLLRETLVAGTERHNDPLTEHHVDRIAQALSGPLQLRVHETAEGPALTVTAQVEDGEAVLDGLRWLLPPASAAENGFGEGVDGAIAVRESGHTFYIVASPTVVHFSTDYASAMTIDRDFLERDQRPSFHFDADTAHELLTQMREPGEGAFLSPFLDALSALANRMAQIRYHADPETGESFIAVTRRAPAP
ncbi:MAG: hypothetical protein ACLFU6_13610, partial [Candidatus Hydrogenedentota bacterium]